MTANIFTGLVNSNWGTTGNWSLTLVPTASDGNPATFNNTSPNCTVDTSARVCNAIDFTGYTNTITMTNQITVSGDITLASTMGVAGAGALIGTGTFNFTSNGKTWPNALTFNGATATRTLLDNAAVSGLLTLSQASATLTLNGFQITASGGITLIAGSNVFFAGTTLLIIGGTSSTITLGATTHRWGCPTTFNASGTITFSGTQWNPNGITVTRTAGTIASGGCILSPNIAGCTFDSMTWDGPMTATAALTQTIANIFVCTGLTTLGTTTTAPTLNGSTYRPNGGLRMGSTTGSPGGTTVMEFTASATLDAPSITTGRINNPITANTGAGGTLTVTSVAAIDFAKFTYTSGTVAPSGAASWPTIQTLSYGASF